MRKLLAPICALLLAATAVSACNLPRPTPAGQANPDAINTQAALTVEAFGTQLSGGTLPAPISAITSTTMPSITAAPSQASSDTPMPGSDTPAPTNSPAPTATQPPPTATPIPCDRAAFVEETIPDGTVVAPGSNFTKSWTLKNDGSCTWNSSYSVVFVSGDALGAPAARQLTTGSVAPGQTIQISMDMKAPATEGTYKGNWKLRNAAGVVFGLGSDAAKNYWVEIKVTKAPSSFIDSYCLAQWTSDAGNLPCPGKSTDTNGFVIKVDAPKLETGSTDDEPALWTNPQSGNNGEISGRFPAMTIASGKRFKTLIGCLYDANNCDVHFVLKYIADGGSVQTLGEWNEFVRWEVHQSRHRSEQPGRKIGPVHPDRPRERRLGRRPGLLAPPAHRVDRISSHPRSPQSWRG